MCAKRKKPAKTNKAIDRPFSTEVWTQACAVADRYQLVLDYEDGCWFGRGLEMPLVFGEGATAEVCVADTREALRGAVATLLELGESVPAPAKLGQRTEQLNIRLSTDEKLAIEAAARAKGYAGTSEFVRAAAVNATQPKGHDRSAPKAGSKRPGKSRIASR